MKTLYLFDAFRKLDIVGKATVIGTLVSILGVIIPLMLSQDKNNSDHFYQTKIEIQQSMFNQENNKTNSLVGLKNKQPLSNPNNKQQTSGVKSPIINNKDGNITINY